MDTAGARALAERIASGKPENAQRVQDDPKPRASVPLARATMSPPSAVQIVYLKPSLAVRHDVRIYVLGRGGGLERRS